MTLNSAIIVDHDDTTALPLSSDLLSINVNCIRASGNQEAWVRLRLEPSIGLAIIRYSGPGLDGVELCRRIRGVRNAEELPIVVVLQDSQLEHGARALEAGANDILVAPFAAGELLLRAGYDRNGERRRIDTPHPETNEQNYTEPVADSPTIMIPWFNREQLKFTFDAGERQLKEWDQDACVDKTLLDVMMVCPECGAIPSFRYGCQSCGSAMMKREQLIHHYKCAHVATEADFRKGNDLQCPKCHTIDLVAGVDFEHVDGSYCCSDCLAVCSALELIGHCLNCQHRFAATDAAVRTLVAYGIPQSATAPKIAGLQRQPWFQRQQSREQIAEYI